jgi:hypothetical protein
MSTLAFLLAQVGDDPAPMFFKRLGEQAFLVILLVASNWLFAKTLLMVRREHIADLKAQIEDLKRQRGDRTYPSQETKTEEPPIV